MATDITTTPKLSPLSTRKPAGCAAIDDDIQKTVGLLLDAQSSTNNFNNVKILKSLEKQVQRTLQFERNLWKDRLHDAMQEIDRQHRMVLYAHSSIQEIMTSLTGEAPNMGDNESDDTYLNLENLVNFLHLQICKLKKLAGLEDVQNIDNIILSDGDISTLQKQILQLQTEKEQYIVTAEQKDKEMKWLAEELHLQRRKLYKLNRLIKNYKDSYIEANFHLDDPADEVDSYLSQKKEVTYNEDDTSTCRSLKMFPVNGEEIALWKARLKQDIYSKRKVNGIGQCLRCQKLFRTNENNSKACRFHNKGREVREIYTTNGKLEKVLYKWACCKKDLEASGCAYGYHI